MSQTGRDKGQRDEGQGGEGQGDEGQRDKGQRDKEQRDEGQRDEGQPQTGLVPRGCPGLKPGYPGPSCGLPGLRDTHAHKRGQGRELKSSPLRSREGFRVSL